MPTSILSPTVASRMSFSPILIAESDSTHLSYLLSGPVNCNDGDIQLVNGHVDIEGRVEVCIDGIWSTMCNNLWGDNDTTVVCNQLGYTGPG